jgi:hypothetical protein
VPNEPDNGEQLFDAREWAIQQLMKEQNISRRKAEGIVAPPGAFELIEKRLEKRWTEGRNQQPLFLKQLHGKGPIGDAFRSLREAGCDPAFLERALCKTYLYPWSRSKKCVTNIERKRVERVIANLEADARELQEHPRILLLSGMVDWPMPPLDAPLMLRGIASCLREALHSLSGRQLKSATAALKIPWIIRQVKAQTGRPHYAQMATLLGAAYNRPQFSEEHLKMHVRRHQPRPRVTVLGQKS